MCPSSHGWSVSATATAVYEWLVARRAGRASSEDACSRSCSSATRRRSSTRCGSSRASWALWITPRSSATASRTWYCTVHLHLHLLLLALDLAHSSHVINVRNAWWLIERDCFRHCCCAIRCANWCNSRRSSRSPFSCRHSLAPARARRRRFTRSHPAPSHRYGTLPVLGHFARGGGAHQSPWQQQLFYMCNPNYATSSCFLRTCFRWTARR